MIWLPIERADIPVKALSKKALLTRPAWLLDGTPFAPEIQIVGNKRTHSYYTVTEPTAFLLKAVETAIMETPVSSAGVKETAVNPEQLPTSNAVSKPTEQPTSLVSLTE